MKRIQYLGMNSALVLFCLLAGIIVVALNSDSIPSPYDMITMGFCEMVAWLCTTILILFVFMHTRNYKALIENTNDYKDILKAILLFGFIALLAMYAGEFQEATLFKFSPSIIILSAIYGGPRVSIPSALLCLVLDFFMPPYFTSTDMTMCTLTILAGLLAGMATYRKAPRNAVLLVPLIVYGAYFAFIPSILSEMGIVDDEIAYNTYLISGVSLLLGSYFLIYVSKVLAHLMASRDVAARSEKDLSIAHEIQMAAVPTEFPNSRSINIHAVMVPAIEVGGDFYDCFTIGRNLTAFVVADVSDKGLPASLLMMRMMGSFKTASMLSNDPGKVLTAVNNELCRNNPAEQFLTAWMGVYDRDTGILQYANAGHTPPYLKGADGQFVKLEVKKGPIIGFSDAVRYNTSTIMMDDGNALFAYTDGVNEAFNTEGEEFGHERLYATLNSSETACARDIIDNVSAALSEFTRDCPASDDVTMLSFKVDRQGYNQITVPGKVEQLDTVNGFIEEVLLGSGCSMKDILKLQIVSEEIFVNICDHAYENMEGDVTVICRYLDNEVKLTFCDDAEFFNPINKDEIEIDEDVGAWPIGGFGIHMVKNLVTYMDYKYFAGKNIFTVWKKLADTVTKEDTEQTQ